MTIETAIQIWRILRYIRRENIAPVRETFAQLFSDPAEIREVCLQPFTLAIGKGRPGITPEWIRHNRSKGKDIGRPIQATVNVTPAEIREGDFLANLYFTGLDPLLPVPAEQPAVQPPRKTYPPLRSLAGGGRRGVGYVTRRRFFRPIRGGKT